MEPPDINRQQLREARLFLVALAHGYSDDPERRLELRCLSKQGRSGGAGPAPRSWYPRTPAAMRLAAIQAIRRAPDWDVYCGVLPRRGERGGRFDVPEMGWLWADVDGGTEGPLAAQELVVGSGLPEPHMAVLSGSGIHAYWKLAAPVALRDPNEVESVKMLLRRLVARIGGGAPRAHADRSRADTASILRVPGTWNHKTVPPKAVRLVHFKVKNPAYSYVWWTANLPAAPSNRFPWETPRPPARVPERLPAQVLQWIKQPAPYGSRHSEMVRIAAALARDFGLSYQLILSILDYKAAISPGPPMDHRELEKIARWAEASTSRPGRTTPCR